MRDKLRLELIRRFRTQIAAAYALGISEPRLSRILRAWVEPSPDEREKLAMLLGRRRLAHLLSQKEDLPKKDLHQWAEEQASA